MKNVVFILIILWPSFVLSQTDVVGKFVDKTYAIKYLEFNSDSTFKFEMGICLQHDIGCGTYKQINDTILLYYKNGMADSCCNIDKVNVKGEGINGKYGLLIPAETSWRPDSLFIKKTNFIKL